MAFTYPESLKLANLPTPIIKLEKTSQRLAGHKIYLKRDDLTGCGVSGNKIRKLEFVLAEAMAMGADVVITCGGLQSNHARATAIACARLGVRAHLVLRGQPEAVPTGNYLLDKLVGCEFTFITREEYREHVDEIMAEVAGNLRRQHQVPYIIPEGASNELGAMGYVRALEEITHQLNQLDDKIEYIVSAVGSGGTMAGQIIGKKLFGLEAELIGINVCDDEAYFVRKIFGILEQAKTRFNLALDFAPADLHIIDGYVGPGYGINTVTDLQFIHRIARDEGIFVDPVYTAKALFGLLQEIEKGRFKSDSNFLFLHTGGIFELFAKAEEFAAIL